MLVNVLVKLATVLVMLVKVEGMLFSISSKIAPVILHHSKIRQNNKHFKINLDNLPGVQCLQICFIITVVNFSL
jgi:hypothetical protein